MVRIKNNKIIGKTIFNRITEKFVAPTYLPIITHGEL